MDEFDDFRARFAAHLRILRHERGLRLVDLEDHGIAMRAVQKAEQGTTYPRLDTLLRLASLYDVKPYELLKVEGVDPRDLAVVEHGGARSGGEPASQAVLRSQATRSSRKAKPRGKPKAKGRPSRKR